MSGRVPAAITSPLAMLYPVAEFRTVARRAVRRGALTFLLAVGTVVLFILTTLHLADRWAVHDVARSLLLVWGTIASAALTLVCEVRWKLARHPFTRCPHCRGRLTEYVPLTIASGCCPYCGVRVLEPPADLPADGLIPRPEYLAADAAYQGRVVPVILGGILSTYAGFCGALGVIDRIHLPEPLKPVVTLALVCVAPVSMVVVLQWIAAGAKRNLALACPACGSLLAGARMVVAATGHCHQCGCRAIVPRTRPLHPPHRGPMWTVAKITEQVSERRRRYWWYVKKRPLVWTTPLVAGYLTAWACFFLLTSAVPARWAGMMSEREREYRSVAAGGAGFGAVGLLAVRWVLRSAGHHHPIDCPRCRREFLPAFARCTKCCSLCGWRIVEG